MFSSGASGNVRDVSRSASLTAASPTALDGSVARLRHGVRAVADDLAVGATSGAGAGQRVVRALGLDGAVDLGGRRRHRGTVSVQKHLHFAVTGRAIDWPKDSPAI